MLDHRSGYPLLVTIFLCCFPLFASAAAEKNATTANLDKAAWAWIDRVGNDNVVRISRNVGGTWCSPETISVQGGINVVPSVTSIGDNDDLFAVWTSYSGSQAQLHYRQMKGKKWTEEQEYYSGLPSNTAATLADDSSGKLWMVWAGFNGISDEIYYSSWNGSAFDTAKAITANEVPDILPILGIDGQTGHPWIQWLQYSETGYKKLESTWNGTAWTKPIQVEAQKTAMSNAPRTNLSMSNTTSLPTKKMMSSTKNATATSEGEPNTVEIEIPSFITHPESASIHIPGYSVRSLPVRSMSVTK